MEQLVITITYRIIMLILKKKPLRIMLRLNFEDSVKEYFF